MNFPFNTQYYIQDLKLYTKPLNMQPSSVNTAAFTHLTVLQHNKIPHKAITYMSFIKGQHKWQNSSEAR